MSRLHSGFYAVKPQGKTEYTLYLKTKIADDALSVKIDGEWVDFVSYMCTL